MATKKLMLSAVAFGVAALFAGSANASTYYFGGTGSLLSGSFNPSVTFATLDVTTSDSTTYNFKLTAKNLDTLFTPGAFIGSMAVDISSWVKSGPQALRDSDPSTAISGSGNGVTFVDFANGGGPTGVFDARYDFGQGAGNRLTGLEYVTWTSTFAKAKTFSNFALHVQGLTEDQGGSAWYKPTDEHNPPPVPLPAAAWLFGSALLGFVSLSNRRKV